MQPIPHALRPLLNPKVQAAIGVILALVVALGILPNSSSYTPSAPVVSETSSESSPPETLEPTLPPIEEPTEEPDSPLPSIANREEHVAAGLTQRGGQIGTGGKPAVALRFDHHLADFETKILPLLKKYRLPWGQMINAGNIGTSESTSFSDLAAITHENGGEVWNHGLTHASIYSEAEADSEITQGLAELKEGLPSLWIDGWAQPGQADYLGLDGTPFTPEHYYDTYPGRLVLGQHAFVRGYYPNAYHQLNGDNFIGQVHVTIDKQTGDRINGYVRRAVAGNTGVTLMLHPNYLDEPGYLTTEELDSSLAYIARLRDQDQIEVLSNTGILMADDDLPEDYGNLLDAAPSTTLEGAWDTDVPRALNHLGVPHEAEVWVSGEGTAILTIEVDSATFPVTTTQKVEITSEPQRLSALVTPPLDAQSVTVKLEGDLVHNGLSYQPV